MKKKNAIMLILQLVAIIAFTFSFYSIVQNQVKPTQAYVFARDMEVNTQVTVNDIKKVSVPGEAVTSKFALNPEEIVGKYLSADVFSGSYVYSNQLQGKGEVDPFKSMDLSTYRKISLPISYVEGFGGDIKKGDRVDLVFVGKGEKENPQIGGTEEFQYSKVFMQDVLVYSVVTGEGYRYESNYKVSESEAVYDDGESISADAGSSELEVVTLAVTLDQAEEILARVNAGAIRLLGSFDEHEAYETMGYVLGDYKKIFSAPAHAETSTSTIK